MMSNFQKTLNGIGSPALLLDEDKCRANIKAMAQRAKDAEVLFRPHFKSHQSSAVGHWFREEGVRCITVSSVGMAGYFADYGWRDITIAFPVNIREIEQLKKLSARVKLNLLVEDVETVRHLDLSGIRADLFVKLDVGARRTGLPVESVGEIIHLAETINLTKGLVLKGLLTHAGHTYRAVGTEAIQEIADQAAATMKQLRNFIGDNSLILSWGDTPSCSLMLHNPGFDEWRPGNFVFYDVMQYHIGSCSLDKIAVVMACPVVAVHRNRRQAVVSGGAIHFSKDSIRADNGFELFGYVVEFTGSAWGETVTGAWLGSISQEHGVVNLPEELCNRVKPGDLIGILPVHSCLTVAAMKEMTTLSGYRLHCMK
jgi:D-serine deaminase-like pyridoxal phosphate-dependent protein